MYMVSDWFETFLKAKRPSVSVSTPATPAPPLVERP